MYVHFENKEDLSLAAVEYNLNKVAGKVMAAVNKQDTAKDKLFAYLDVVSDPIHPPAPGGCPMLNFGMEADDNFPAINAAVQKALDFSQQAIVNIIKKGIQGKEFRAGWNAGDFAVKMFAMIEGGILLSRVAGNSQKMKIIVRLLKKEIEEQVL